MSAPPAVNDPGPPAAAWSGLVLAEVRMVYRDPSGLVVPLAVPLLLLVMFGLSGAGTQVPGTGGLTVLDLYGAPIALMVVLSSIGVINMPSFLATYRRTGVLKRLSVTPVHPSMVLLAQVVVSLAQTMLGVALALVIGRLAFGLAVPRDLPTAIGVLILATAALFALGLLVAAVSPTPGSSVAVGMVVFFGIGAAGGLFGPTDVLPDAVARVGEILPFGAGIQGLQAAWLDEPVPVRSVTGLLVTTLLTSVLSARLFRWT
ncbi:ABC transporter [Humibacillus sp. DSM 29435]|uniref:ABC transporter permease n=1 Tax=Humibacillus sp. DSM 29435 TaxID=1869167 RepID=UPI000871C3FB|nr:ABC transporter permease [Humibacillus sp. DSM 29435]OFE17135.1 ABC transporter [Humibacillus sp. DSM 29435]